jgi:hypothetical protein
MSVCIKPIGDWSLSLLTKLFSSNSAAPKSAQTSRAQISSSQKSAAMSCPFAIGHLFAEGPYGHESNYFLRSVCIQSSPPWLHLLLRCFVYFIKIQ